MINPRERISWVDRHMLEALLSAQRSPDPNTQVGACIVNKHNRIVSSGYNSYPNGVGIKTFSWARIADDELNTKYPYVVHAEKNAIYNAARDISNCILYVTLYPCNECAKDILQANIKKVIYLSNPYKETQSIRASSKLFDAVDLTVIKHKWQNKNTILSCLQKISKQI